ncbi:hypothetical protein Drorol1_Dr00003458 [Drosera rotundifolia]
MDSWKSLSDEKNMLLSEEVDCAVDGLGRYRSKVVGMGYFPHNDNYPFISNTEALESLEFMGLGFPDMIRKPYSSDRSGDRLSDEVGADSYENLASPTATSNIGCGGKESGLNSSSYFMESNSEGWPPIDLKLGWLPNSKGYKDGEFPKSSKDIAVVVSSSPTKRARSRSLQSPNPCCQVYGCNKDLSSSKEYHKRHKVCDVHSKTAKVVVNGVEQRFCQQCSRFHLLSEFDDVKRSCRKRLANHNERRRKPQIATHSSSRFMDPSLVKRASFLFPNMLPGSIFSPSKHEAGKWRKNFIKFEDPARISNPLPSMHGIGERMVNAYPGPSDDVVGMAAPRIQDKHSASTSSCALSLLSTQSDDFSRDIVGSTIANPHFNKSNHSHYSGKFSSSVLQPPVTESVRPDERMYDASMFYGGHDVNFKVPGGTSHQTSEFIRPKYGVPSGQSVMSDLFQLSSQLERVEQQRTSMMRMQQNDAFFARPQSSGNVP